MKSFINFCFISIVSLAFFVSLLLCGVDGDLSLICLPSCFCCGVLISERVFFKPRTNGPFLFHGIPAEKKAGVVIFTHLDKAETAFCKAEKYYLENRDENLCFILLCDSGDSNYYWSVQDENATSAVMKKAAWLNGIYGERFFFALPKRTYDLKRKRFGKGTNRCEDLFNLIQYIKGDSEKYTLFCGNRHFLKRIKYLILTDDECDIEPGGVNRIMAHMLCEGNRPLVSGNRVVSGYGVLIQGGKEFRGYGAVNCDLYHYLIDFESCGYAFVETKLNSMCTEQSLIHNIPKESLFETVKRRIGLFGFIHLGAKYFVSVFDVLVKCTLPVLSFVGCLMSLEYKDIRILYVVLFSFSYKILPAALDQLLGMSKTRNKTVADISEE